MDVTGRSIFHKKYGEGKVISLEDARIRVDFNGGERLFACTDAFVRLISGDDELITYLINYINDIESKTRELRSERLAMIERQLKERRTDAQENSGNCGECYNLAVNAVYCDGGRNDNAVGFNGVCSDSVLEQNVNATDGRWCTKHDCRCGVYAMEKGTAIRRELDRLMEDGGFVCPESRMLRDWVVSEGVDNDRRPRNLNIDEGKICVLTTVDPQDNEEDRYIFAIYIIGSIDKDINGIARVWADSRCRYAFSPEDAKKMKFWDFFPDEDEWGNDRFILLDDIVCETIIKTAYDLTGEEALKAMLYTFRETEG